MFVYYQRFWWAKMYIILWIKAFATSCTTLILMGIANASPLFHMWQLENIWNHQNLLAEILCQLTNLPLEINEHISCGKSLFLSDFIFILWHISHIFTNMHVLSWRIVIISGTVHWFWLKTSFHPLLWTSSSLTGSWKKLSAYTRFGSLRSVKSVKTRGNWKPKKCWKC